MIFKSVKSISIKQCTFVAALLHCRVNFGFDWIITPRSHINSTCSNFVSYRLHCKENLSVSMMFFFSVLSKFSCSCQSASGSLLSLPISFWSRVSEISQYFNLKHVLKKSFPDPRELRFPFDDTVPIMLQSISQAHKHRFTVSGYWQ